MLLVGDIGGTKTLLGLCEPLSPRPTIHHVQRFSTLDYHSLEDLLAVFLGTSANTLTLEAAILGVAGPVRNNSSTLTNVPWQVNASQLAKEFNFPKVYVLNDLVAMGYAVPVLSNNEVSVVHAGRPDPNGNKALMAPGTGFGETTLVRVGNQLLPVASEAGHADFSARTPLEIRLLEYLKSKSHRISNEQVLSGPGLTSIHQFAHSDVTCTVVSQIKEPNDFPAAIIDTALAKGCNKCVDALNLFVGALGAEAGNHGLRSLATAGIYIGGGMASRILPALRSPIFLNAFREKRQLAELITNMPITVINAPYPGLIGASIVARNLVTKHPTD